jgi:hypothetical protein
MSTQRLAIALLIGCAIGLATVMMLSRPVSPDWLAEILTLFAAPGLTIAVIFARNVHTYILSTAAQGNAFFYTVLTYVLLTMAERRRVRRGRVNSV